ncbi:hypothetical protein WDW86_12310 [Bdellovibrionota bacterium FG-2]
MNEFRNVGIDVQNADQFLALVHEENRTIDLTTLDGISIQVPIDSVSPVGYIAPRNVSLRVSQ